MAVTRIPPTLPEHTTRDEEALRADITETEQIETDCYDGHLRNKRWVVDCGEYGAKPQYGKPHIVTVWSPCCGRPRQQIQHGYAFSCPACGWWWRYHYTGTSTRFVSLGKDRPK